MEFIEMEHTPKNVLLVGRKIEKPVNQSVILDEIKNLKQRFGIKQHYLETVLDIGE